MGYGRCRPMLARPTLLIQWPGGREVLCFRKSNQLRVRLLLPSAHTSPLQLPSELRLRPLLSGRGSREPFSTCSRRSRSAFKQLEGIRYGPLYFPPGRGVVSIGSNPRVVHKKLIHRFTCVLPNMRLYDGTADQ